MGIIFRQTLKSSVYSYIGVLFGFITAGWLMPRYLSTSEIGVIRQIQYYALFISSIIAFGIPQSLVRMFPHFKNGNNNYGFASLISFITLISSIVFSFIFNMLGELILKKDIEKSILFAKFHPLILPFTLALLIFSLYDSYANVNKESTIGVFLKDFFLRIILLVALLGLILDWYNFDRFIYLYTYIQFVPILLLIWFLLKKKLLPITTKIKFPSIKIRNDFFTVAGFNWVNGLSSVAVVTIDSIMLSKMVDSAAVGVYTTITFYTGLMLIPNKSLGKIASAIIAQSFKDKDIENIKTIYQKSALSLLIVGLFLLGNLILAIPIIFDFLLSSDFYEGKWVLVILAITNLLKMATGIKFSIIFTSRYYRWSTFLFIGFLALIVITNLMFIPQYGISGAAIASLISTSIFHISGLILVKYKFDYWPFKLAYMKTLVIFTILFFIIFFIPDWISPFFDSMLKCSIFSSTFGLFIYFSNISPKTNETLNKFLKRLFC